MSRGQLHPLEINPHTGEPFLRLSAPHDNIIITPPRMDDVKKVLPIMNDPRVISWLEAPPVPYLEKHSEQWLTLIMKASEKTLAELREEERLNPDGPPKVVRECPVRHIREVLPDGTEIYLGDIWIHRAQMEEVLDADEKKKAVEANDAKAVGDPSIVWTFGDYLAPSHHGRGIMSAAMDAIIHQWAIPRMGAEKLVGYTFADNVGSKRVFEKNGFKLERVVDNGKVVRGEPKKLNYLCWHR